MSILRIPSLKKMYGTTEFAIDWSTGQLYTVGEVDVSPVNLFGGIPDEGASGKTTESTWLPPQAPQAMSTPITEILKSTPTTMVTRDRVPLFTPMILVSHPKEGETSTSSSTLSDPSVNPPLKKINRANVRAAPSVSNLEERRYC